MSRPLRLRLDGDALAANWRWLAKRSGRATCGAAVKADGYGLGAHAVVARLAREGCRDFFVATYAEAVELGSLPEGCSLSVLHGPRVEDMDFAARHVARPVINSPEQAARWRDTGRSCDAMMDTGMNRLGLRPEQAGALDGLEVDTLMSHLACADEDSDMNVRQRDQFAALQRGARRYSLANSAGVCLGSDYAFDLTRPGLALYGGVPRAEAAGCTAQVAFPEAQIVQRRRVPAGETVGYGATWTAAADTDVAILNIGYADGYLRSFAGIGTAEGGALPLLGRVSMDLVAIDVSRQPALREGDWVGLDYALPQSAAASGLSQYELLTGLGGRFVREWRDKCATS
jgi:alanine racemase